MLSLDFAAEGLRGPTALLSEPGLWPDRIIAMSLDRVGTDNGPDVERLETVAKAAGAAPSMPRAAVRSIGDLEAIAAAGAHGALIATALHAGAITQNEIAAFLQRRRSRSDQIRNPAF